MAKRKLTYRKKKTASRRMRSKRPTFQKKVRTALSGMAETKIYRTQTIEGLLAQSTAGTYPGFTTGASANLSAINSRIGNEVYTKGNYWNWAIKNTYPVSIYVRVLLVRPKDVAQAVASGLVDFYQGETAAENATGDLSDITRDVARQNFTVLRDRTYTMTAAGGDRALLHHRWRESAKGKLNFGEPSDLYPSNRASYLVIIPRRGDNDGTAGDALIEASVTTSHKYTDM